MIQGLRTSHLPHARPRPRQGLLIAACSAAIRTSTSRSMKTIRRKTPLDVPERRDMFGFPPGPQTGKDELYFGSDNSAAGALPWMHTRSSPTSAAAA